MHDNISTLIVALTDIEPSLISSICKLANIDVDFATFVVDEVLKTNIHNSVVTSKATSSEFNSVVTANVASQTLTNIDVAIGGFGKKRAGIDVSFATVVDESVLQVEKHV